MNFEELWRHQNSNRIQLRNSKFGISKAAQMNVTSKQLDDFYRFGTEQIATMPMSWDELFIRWESLTHRDRINNAIREGIEEIKAGRFKPVDEVLKGLKERLKVEGDASKNL